MGKGATVGQGVEVGATGAEEMGKGVGVGGMGAGSWAGTVLSSR